MNDVSTKPDAEAGPTTAGKYLTFVLHEESFAVDVLQVREIIRAMSITTVPQMPQHVRGIINLRGKIIPVVDLRVRFGFPKAENTDHTCIIVVQVNCIGRKPALMGVIVDDVEEVIHLGPADIEEIAQFGAGIVADSIIGMAKMKGAVKALLNLDRILDPATATPAPTFAPPSDIPFAPIPTYP